MLNALSQVGRTPLLRYTCRGGDDLCCDAAVIRRADATGDRRLGSPQESNMRWRHEMNKMSRTVLALLLVAAIGLTAGCTPKASPASLDTVPFVAAARSFVDQATAAAERHLTAEPVVTIVSKQIHAEIAEVILEIQTTDVLTDSNVDAQTMIAGELKYLRDQAATVSTAARGAIERDIADWRNKIKSAMVEPGNTNYIVKVVGKVNPAGAADTSSLQVYVSDQAGGAYYSPTAEVIAGRRPYHVSITQAYADADSVAIQTDARDSIAAEQVIMDYFKYWNEKNLPQMEKLMTPDRAGMTWNFENLVQVQVQYITERTPSKDNRRDFVVVYHMKLKKAPTYGLTDDTYTYDYLLKRDSVDSPWLIYDWQECGE
jgi:hypothetical protein